MIMAFLTVIIVYLLLPYAGAADCDCHLQSRSDDTSSVALQTLVQQQATQLQELQAKVAAMENQQSANTADLAQLKAHRQKQAAFSVSFSGNQHPLNVGDNAALIFDLVITNIGNAYSPLTGHFVAPFSGVYAFFCNLRSDNNHGWIAIGIFKGSTMLVTTTADGNLDAYDKGNAYVTTHLNMGESVHVQHTGGDTYVESGLLTTFTGVLVSAD